MGVIYLRRILDIRFDGTTAKKFQTFWEFRELGTSRKIVFVMNLWAAEGSEEFPKQEKYEIGPSTNVQFFKPVLVLWVL